MTCRDPSRVLLGALVATVLLAAASAALARHLVVNLTESMPRGLYWLSAPSTVHRGDRVAFPVPSAVQALVRERAYLPDRAWLLKEVVATSGDRVCTDTGVLRINGAVFGAISARDSTGRPLPQVPLCGVLPPGQFYVASAHPRSFDSRAFGPLQTRDLRGKVTPLWTY